MRRKALVVPVVGGVLLFAWAGSAFAHAHLTSPLRRANCQSGDQAQCKPPAQGGTAVPGGCGGTPNPAVTPTTYEVGTVVPITFDETINHVGRYRLALSTNGETAFDTFVIMDYGVTTDIGPPGPNSYTWNWTVPDTTNCNPCVLQLIQGMDDDMNGSFDTTYYNCADVMIVPAGAPTPTPGSSPTPTPNPSNPNDPVEVDAYGSCSVAVGTVGIGVLAPFGLLALVLWRRRRA